MSKTTYDVLIAGAGAAGLTCAAYLSRSGYSVLLCEAGEKTGGLVHSFEHGGYVFDGGIRAFENSGIIFPMLQELDIKLDVVRNPVSIGIGEHFCKLKLDTGLADYRNLLCSVFPASTQEIDTIILEIKKAMTYMDVLYGIDNPLFGDVLKDNEYLFKTLLPWLPRYYKNIAKVRKMSTPVYEHLRRLTSNTALIDMIAQHFFSGTPASFALSYFSLYLDYSYPVGGTGMLAQKLTEKIDSEGGVIALNTRIISVDPGAHLAVADTGDVFEYQKLIWACDMTALYTGLQTRGLETKSVGRIQEQKKLVDSSVGTESILTLFMTVNSGAENYEGKVSAHCFYTPDSVGLSTLPSWREAGIAPENQVEVKNWLQQYLSLTTYEISIPKLRDGSLAPEGCSGIIVSTLFDYGLVKAIHNAGWYDAFKAFCSQTIIDILDHSSFPLTRVAVTSVDCSTPMTIQRLTGNKSGAVTGWSFTNLLNPAVSDMKKIAKAVMTPIPDVYQAGHWTFSPAGLPIAVLTGKLAADAVDKELKNK